MNQRTLILLMTLILALPTLAVSVAEAVPSFSRQMQVDCRSCHFMDMHGLNATGRAFKRNAFKMDDALRAQLAKQHADRDLQEQSEKKP